MLQSPRLWLRWVVEFLQDPVVLALAGLAFPVAVVLAGLLMIRCSGLQMRPWTSLAGWRGRKRSWRR